MHDFILDRTDTTPRVRLLSEGYLSLEGCCFPENSEEFFKPILDWCIAYSKMPNKKTRIEINLAYINSSSTYELGKLLKVLSQRNSINQSELDVHWVVDLDDSEMAQTIFDFRALHDNTRFTVVQSSLPPK